MTTLTTSNVAAAWRAADNFENGNRSDAVEIIRNAPDPAATAVRTVYNLTDRGHTDAANTVVHALETR